MPRHAPRPELADAKSQGFHNIGEAAALTGVSAKMIRHYESIDLIPQAGRTFAGYRIYTDNDLHCVRFIKRARTLGFSMKEIANLLGLWDDRARASSDVKKLARQHAEALAEKIAEMQSMQRTLEDLARRCHGDARPDCRSSTTSRRSAPPRRNGVRFAHMHRAPLYWAPTSVTFNVTGAGWGVTGAPSRSGCVEPPREVET